MASVTTYQVEEWFTADDLDSMGDQERYELLDGELFAVPSPTMRHQRISGELFVLLRNALSAGLRVVAAPMDVRFGPRRQVQPDLLVVPTALDADRVEEPPLLVVEILSRGTRGRDQTTKRRVYEQAGVPSYWLVDPDRTCRRSPRWSWRAGSTSRSRTSRASRAGRRSGRSRSPCRRPRCSADGGPRRPRGLSPPGVPMR